MDAQSRQKALDNISPEDLAKIEAHKADASSRYPVDQEWLILTEFALLFGWQAYLDAKNDATDENGNLIVNTDEMMMLLVAARKLKYEQLYDNAQSSFIGAVSARSDKPSNTFTNLTKKILQLMKADKS